MHSYLGRLLHFALLFLVGGGRGAGEGDLCAKVAAETEIVL